MKRGSNEVITGQNAPSFAEALTFWIRLGFISFGGPTGQIAIMHHELVERKKWISEERFLHALNYCMLLPGPEAQQLATYAGWLLHRTKGGIAAGLLFVLPSVFILWTLSLIYVTYGGVPAIAAIFRGLKPAVLAIVAAAVIRLGRKALRNEVMWSAALLAFIAIYFFHIPFPLIIAAAALIGFIGAAWWKKKFLKGAPPRSEDAVAVQGSVATAPSSLRVFKVILVSLAVWWAPILAAGATLGFGHTVFQQGVFFSKAAMVTFGGAYAVLPYVAEEAVNTHGWLSTGQMVDGLGLAETTPGPLIMVLQFVGFVGGWNNPGSLSPLAAASLGAFITTWATFAPCFLWIFLGAPYVERLRGSERLSAALTTVTAAVVGVIINLAIWFGSHVLFDALGGIDVFAAIICAAAFLALVRFKVDMVAVIGVSALLGLLGWFAGGL